MIVGIDIKIILAIISTIVAIIWAFIPYLKDIFLNKTKPHAYTWLIWAITQGTAVVGLWYGNGGWGGLTLTVGTFFIFFIFFLSLKYGTYNITKSDTVILTAALLAIVVWWKLSNPLLAIFMVSAIDILGYIPSFRKTFDDPWTETVISWAVFALVNTLSIFALNEYNFLTLTYLISITAADVILLAICLIRRRVILSNFSG